MQFLIHEIAVKLRTILVVMILTSALMNDITPRTVIIAYSVSPVTTKFHKPVTLLAFVTDHRSKCCISTVYIGKLNKRRGRASNY